MASYKETFFIVPSYILDLPNISMGYLRVYQALFQFWNKSLPCFLNNKAIAERSGVEIRQVQYALDFFEKNGELARIQKGLKRYLSRPERLIEHDCNENVQACTPVHPPMHSSAPPPCTPVHPEYKEIEYKENKDIKEKIYKKENLLPVVYEETFYPVKQKQEFLNENPHAIPRGMIEDWMKNRLFKKSPVTKTAWVRLNNQLAKCPNPREAFEEMVARGWMSINPEWLESSKKKNSYHDNESTEWIKDINKELF